MKRKGKIVVLVAFCIFISLPLFAQGAKDKKGIIETILTTNFVQEKPRYRTHQEIGSFLKEIARKHKNITNLRIIGQSLENRNIYCLELGKKSAPKKILIVANAHGEELRGTEETLYIIKALTQNQFIKETFLDKFHFTIIPTINPDAREYNLIWATKNGINWSKFFLSAKRKVLNKQGKTVDIEWSYPFNDQQIVKRPETKALMKLMNERKFDFYIDIHANTGTYKQGFLYLVGQNGKKELSNFLHLAGVRSNLSLANYNTSSSFSPQLKRGVHELASVGERPTGTKYFPSWKYFKTQNPQSQFMVSELSMFISSYNNDSETDILEMRAQEYLIRHHLEKWKNVKQLTEKALELSSNPVLKKFEEKIKQHIKILRYALGMTIKSIPYSKKATKMEIHFFEMDKEWLSPGYGIGGYGDKLNLITSGLGYTISTLPVQEQKKLKDIFKLCEQETEKSVRELKTLGLIELPFTDSVNIQVRTCLGAILTNFAN